jgi:integrase
LLDTKSGLAQTRGFHPSGEDALAASLCKAAGLDTKFISALLGHSRTSFTDATYVLVFPEVAEAAAEAAAAAMPRRNRAATPN